MKKKLFFAMLALTLLFAASSYAEDIEDTDEESAAAPYTEPGYLLVPSYQRTIDSIRNVGVTKDNYYVLLNGGLYYDTNATLAPKDNIARDFLKANSDLFNENHKYTFGENLGVAGDYFLLKGADKEVTASYSFSQTLNSSAHGFDFQRHAIDVKGVFRTDISGLPLYLVPRYTFGLEKFGFQGGYLYSHTLNPVIALAENKANLTQVEYSVRYAQYHGNTTTQRAGLTHYYRFRDDMHYIYAGYFYGHNNSDRPFEKYRSLSFVAGFLATLPYDVRLNADYEYASLTFYKSRSVPDFNTRNDDDRSLSVSLTKEMLKGLVVKLQYQIERNGSNDIFSRFDRDITSLGATYIF